MPVVSEEQQKLAERYYPEAPDEFRLQGFSDERDHFANLTKNEKALKIKKSLQKSITVHEAIQCPIALTYLHLFLIHEFNIENLQCLLELRSLYDFIKNARESVIFTIGVDKEQEEEEIKKICSQNCQYVTQVFNRMDDFVGEFVGKTSKNEVNLPNYVVENIKEAHAKAMLFLENTHQMKYALEEKNLHLQEVTKNFLRALDGVKSELLINLNDPFQRFLASKQFDEMFSLFMGTEDHSFHRARILTANKGGIVLNSDDRGWNKYSKARHPSTVSEELLQETLNLLDHPFYWDRNMNIRYDRLTPESLVEGISETKSFQAKHPQLKEIVCWEKIVSDTYELSQIDLNQLRGDDELIAFFVNVYNMMNIHATIVAKGSPLLEMSRALYLRKIKYNIGGLLFSLEDIRAGVLLKNGNRSILFSPQFNKSDPRSKYVVQSIEPNMIFAMTDMSFESPRIDVLKPSELKSQLKSLAIKYIETNVSTVKNDENKCISTPHTCFISSIFQSLGLSKSSSDMSRTNLKDNCSSGQPNNVPYLMKIPFLITESQHIFKQTGTIKNSKLNTVEYVYQLYVDSLLEKAFAGNSTEDAVQYNTESKENTQNKVDIISKDDILFDFSSEIKYDTDFTCLLKEDILSNLKKLVVEIYPEESEGSTEEEKGEQPKTSKGKPLQKKENKKIQKKQSFGKKLLKTSSSNLKKITNLPFRISLYPKKTVRRSVSTSSEEILSKEKKSCKVQ